LDSIKYNKQQSTINNQQLNNFLPNYVTSSSSLNEIHLQVLRAVESRPGLTQRELANELGVSLGKAHYCMKALIEKGLVKMGNFSHNQKKLDYAYLLTPSGIKSKAVLTAHFLERKAAEYAALKRVLDGIGAASDIKGLASDTKTGQIENLEKQSA
jgi:EPS-associated MarR family transcriptional regulator